MKICFATNNPNKVEEINALLPEGFEILGLEAIGFQGDIPEDQPTIAGNSAQKANHIHDRFQIDCFADDTGLEVDALNGEPGVYSARYGGPERDATRNMEKVLTRLQGHHNRSAQFRTVISLILSGEMHQFEGIVRGQIVLGPRGNNGFGYDPIFLPEGHDRTFAEMTAEEKNGLSHRGIAIRKLVSFLSERQA